MTFSWWTRSRMWHCEIWLGANFRDSHQAIPFHLIWKLTIYMSKVLVVVWSRKRFFSSVPRIAILSLVRLWSFSQFVYLPINSSFYHGHGSVGVTSNSNVLKVILVINELYIKNLNRCIITGPLYYLPSLARTLETNARNSIINFRYRKFEWSDLRVVEWLPRAIAKKSTIRMKRSWRIGTFCTVWCCDESHLILSFSV